MRGPLAAASLVAVATVAVPSARAGDAAAIPPALAKVAEKTRAIGSLRVHMRQEKEMAVFGEKLVAEGTLAFARPRRLMMDLTGQGGTRIVIDGDAMAMHYKALKKTERFSLSRDPRARAVAEHLFLLLDADPEPLAEIYRLELIGESPLRVRLVPRPKALAAIIARVEARFDRRGFIDELTMFEANGDLTRWIFSDPAINEPLPDGTFKVEG